MYFYLFLRKEHISALEHYVIIQVACGAAHSLAITEWGQLYSWGSNSRGQLASDTKDDINATPKLVKQLATKHVVQIASGRYHSLALTNSRWVLLLKITANVIVLQMVKCMPGVQIIMDN